MPTTYPSFSTCHNSKAKLGKQLFFPFLLHFVPMSHTNRAKLTTQSHFLTVSHGNSFLQASSALLLKATLILPPSLSCPLVLFAIVIWISSLFFFS